MLTIGRANDPVTGEPDVAALHAKLISILSRIPGFVGSTVWQAVATPTEFLLVDAYEDAPALEAAQVAVVEEGFMETAIRSFRQPFDLRQGEIKREQGRIVSETAIGDYLSLSDRTADPGHGRELEDELTRVFSELESIDGYLGSVIARNVNLGEEVLGVVLWQTEQAFRLSLPLKLLYEVRLYRRII